MLTDINFNLVSRAFLRTNVCPGRQKSPLDFPWKFNKNFIRICSINYTCAIIDINMNYNFSNFRNELKKVVDFLGKEYNQLNIGRASPMVLDGVSVESYGARVPLKNVASVSIEDPKTLRIAPWDKNQIKDIEKAVVGSNLGLSVATDDLGIRVIFPQLTTETRQRLVKVLKDKLEDDLKRRDFTINAIAYNVSKKQVIDLCNGQQDIKDMIIRTVGKPRERFSEDALRMLRGIRLATQLGFMINADTEKAILMMGSFMNNISAERIQDEFVKIIMSDEPMKGLITANKLGILKYIVPELETGIGIKQNKDHIYEVWEHLLRSIQHSAKRSWPLHVRLSALFHDIAKPKTRFWMDEKKDYTFYGHDVVGARIANEIMVRLKFSKKMIETVTKLVRNHMFFSDIDQITLSAVRRLVSRVGPENVWDLMRVRACDRIGMGKPKETPYRLRKYESMIEEAMRAPVSVGMLKIDGIKIMDVIHETPSPRIGYILHALLEEVLENPSLNTTEYLEKKTKELAQFPEKDLKNLGKAGKACYFMK